MQGVHPCKSRITILKHLDAVETAESCEDKSDWRFNPSEIIPTILGPFDHYQLPDASTVYFRISWLPTNRKSVAATKGARYTSRADHLWMAFELIPAGIGRLAMNCPHPQSLRIIENFTTYAVHKFNAPVTEPVERDSWVWINT